ncbi:meiotically up-regulated protein 182 [Metarhizium album ARSEF 1941]|uniref:NAD(P)H-hydrate epimerase n=1 Tax=Metarhizium album (strain ARSEF 1941) TaxID=1081103 RepID=A0A0B2X3H0_METAS|nr:meiotically up-regulated protein 182 [Metarhizium album ARSEF 1941]KHO00263.1 meiotically up-regulated protein 182 [Metarhizium album ARSEF 1941]
MALKTLGAKAAAALDQELMSTCAFSIDQLMELAGLSVSQAGRRVLVACGPGNNGMPPQLLLPSIIWDSDNRQGGDGLVAARHLFYYGYQPTVFYPKRSKNELYQRLAKQLEDLDVPFVEDFQSAVGLTDHIVDAIFGFSFSGDVREPFPKVIQTLEETKVPVTSVDTPSSWDVECGPPKSGLGSAFMPATLVSLTAPKPLVKFFKGRHFVGGRSFVSPSIAKKYGFEVPEYFGVDQIVEVPTTSEKL